MSDLAILDYSVYGNVIDAESDRLLAEAARRLGLRASVVPIAPGSRPDPGAHVVWLRFDLRGPADLAWTVATAHALRDAGHAVFPSPEAILAAEDKWETFQRLRAHGVPTPGTRLGSELHRLPLPAMLKPRVGWGGRDNHCVRDEPSRAARAADAHDANICQPFIPHTRTWVAAAAGGALVTALQERREWNAEVDFSREKARIVTLPAEARPLVFAAIEAVGLVAGTVDLIESEEGFQVLEVNAAPRIAYPRHPTIDLALPMVGAVIQSLEVSRCA